MEGSTNKSIVISTWQNKLSFLFIVFQSKTTTRHGTASYVLLLCKYCVAHFLLAVFLYYNGTESWLHTQTNIDIVLNLLSTSFPLSFTLSIYCALWACRQCRWLLKAKVSAHLLCHLHSLNVYSLSLCRSLSYSLSSCSELHNKNRRKALGKGKGKGESES